MKKIIAILLVLTMVFSMSLVTFARNWIVSPEPVPEDDDNGKDSPKTGDSTLLICLGTVALASISTAAIAKKKLDEE